MKQQCHLSMIWLSWVVYLGGLGAILAYQQWILAAFWIVFVPLAQFQYIRRFPAISGLMGYGPITDQPAPKAEAAQPRQHVVLYTALGCPFCPLIEQRLEHLQATLEFSLEKIDVALRPGLLIAKHIRAVPAVEVNGQILTGLISSRDLAAAIAPAAAVAGA